MFRDSMMALSRGFAVVLVMTLVLAGAASAAPPIHPYESDVAVAPTAIDRLVLEELGARGIEPANPCSDEAFVRRVFLDVIGTLPEPAEVTAFLEDKRPHKRAVLIDELLGRDEFADYWAMKWCDLLRVKSEYPINLWPNAVQAYHRWVHDAIRDNLPYDRFVRELLTSSGSNFRVAPVNFYRAVQSRKPAGIADAVALTFMGTRFDKWPESYRSGMAVFFSRIAYKPTGEWKEEIVCLDPAPTQTLTAMFPDGRTVAIAMEQDPRAVFAGWLIGPQNPWFAKCYVNRAWSWLMGRGIVHEPDDIRRDNPPVNPRLLEYLEKELAGARYDTRHIFRLILNSRTYQQSCIPRSSHPDAERLFAYYPVRRLDAEVLVDALSMLGGAGEEYSSPIPEPFTFVPGYQRSIALADGSIGSSFLELFGRPSRDTGLESERSNQPSESQRLHLLNSTQVQRKIERGERLRKLIESARGNRREMVRMTYLSILSRYPTDEEIEAVAGRLRQGGGRPKQLADDLAWALINTKEFLYRH